MELDRAVCDRARKSRDAYRFRLSYRPPYDWEALAGFLSARATPGVESVDRSGYRRTIAINGTAGSIAVAPVIGSPAITLEVRFPDPNRLLSIVERVKRVFDVAADPTVIADHLAVDPLLKNAWQSHAGIRVPGAWDPFELAVRAILGQQISVRAATTMAGRVATRWGTPVAGGTGLDRLFPTAAQLRNAPIEETGVIASRASAIRALAGAVHDGALVFDAASCLDALRAIPGIGEWTTQYVAMRALNEPDAFLCGDLVLRKMAGNCSPRELEARSAQWRPWRGYAVMLLWQSAVDRQQRQSAAKGDKRAQTAHARRRSRDRRHHVATAASR